MMKTKQWIGLGTSLLLMIGCSTDEKMDTPASQPEVTAYPITCSVHQTGSMPQSRALIDGANQAERDAALQTACTPGIGGEAIAIYGNYTMEGGAATTVFTNTSLVYDASVGTNDETNQINWNYNGEQFWVKDAVYTFRACYPQETFTGSTTSVEVTDYNTLSTQKDLMTAYAQVDTKTNPTAMQDPVTLNMNHALAAVCFIVKSGDKDGSDMELASLTFKGLYSVGSFIYNSNAAPKMADWMNRKDIADYKWTKGGLTFKAETLVKGFSSTTLPTYAEDGYILVIPQDYRSPQIDLKTTERTYTGVSLGNNVTYEPGKKYTYVITVSPNQLKVTLSIKAWHKLNSSYDIIF